MKAVSDRLEELGLHESAISHQQMGEIVARMQTLSVFDSCFDLKSTLRHSIRAQGVEIDMPELELP
jgi:hypothetical protein